MYDSFTTAAVELHTLPNRSWSPRSRSATKQMRGHICSLDDLGGEQRGLSTNCVLWDPAERPRQCIGEDGVPLAKG